MTLQEGIDHLKDSLDDPKHKWSCKECKEEHEQLLQWLTELQKSREIISILSDILDTIKLSDSYKFIQLMKMTEEISKK